MSTEQVRTGSGATPPSGSEVYSEDDYEPSQGRLRPSSNDQQEETPTAHDACTRGRDHMLRSSQKCNEYLYEFRENH